MHSLSDEKHVHFNKQFGSFKKNCSVLGFVNLQEGKRYWVGSNHQYLCQEARGSGSNAQTLEEGLDVGMLNRY